MDLSKIDRINALARKQRAEGLTPAELEEQRGLRAEYVAAVRRNMQAQLEDLTAEADSPGPADGA